MEKIKGISFSLSLVVAIAVIARCNVSRPSQPARRVCAASDVAQLVGNAIGSNDPSAVKEVLLTGADLAWLQNAPKGRDDDETFERHVYQQATNDVRAWSKDAGRGHAIQVDVSAVQRGRALEGFDRRTDVIDDAVVFLKTNGGTKRVVIEHMFLVDGCWRVAEIGSPAR